MRRALVIADGDVPPVERLRDHLLGAGADTIVIAADGGLRKAEMVGLSPQVVVGDADSLPPAIVSGLQDRDIELQLHPSEKDASDTELAVLEAIRRGATTIVVLGALGGLRFEHSLANVLLLTLPALAEVDVALVDGATTVRLARPANPIALTGQPGDLVSLLPLSERVTGVRTQGLRYPLAGQPLDQGPSLGLSNVMVSGEARVEVEEGRLAVVHTELAAGGGR